MSNNAVIVERTFNATAEQIWQALTNSTKMKQWYFDIPGFKPEKDFLFRFAGTDNSGKTYMHLCEVTKAIPNKKLSHSWRYEGYPGNSIVTWDLLPEGEKTKVKLTHTGLETFPADVEAFARENFVMGWTEIVGTSLKGFVEG